QLKRHAVDVHGAALGQPKTRERMQGERLAAAVSPENRREFPGAKPDGKPGDELTRARRDVDGARDEPVYLRVHPISAAVRSPTSTPSSDTGISCSRSDSARWPAMISAKR